MRRKVKGRLREHMAAHGRTATQASLGSSGVAEGIRGKSRSVEDPT